MKKISLENIMNCHICKTETDFLCDNCDAPVCEDCCVQMTAHNRIDYPLCVECEDDRQCDRADKAVRKQEYIDKKQVERHKINAARKAIYWKPENVEKRRLAKIERKKRKVEQREKALLKTFKAIASMFNNNIGG